jgi:hypothetical protein
MAKPLTNSKQTGADSSETLQISQPSAALPWRLRLRAALPATLAWALPFTAVLGMLLLRNAFLFSTPQYEQADMGANSILIEQARRFTLLVGNYSREGFHHPGPAYMYVQSWGESLFWSVLHIVPTAWNGQLIALYMLNACLAALTVAVGYGWTRSVGGAAAVLAVVLLYGTLHPSVFNSDWMPYEYTVPYLCFLVATTSVAAGRTADAWIAALSGWYLIHGHASFLFFVPLLSLAALAVLLWPRRRSLPAAVRSLFPPRVWVPVAAISAIFALPIVLELVLHWPGNFADYFRYSSSSRSGGHSAAQITDYALWFWWPRAGALAVAVGLCAVATLVTWRMPAGQVRRFCASLLAFDAVSTAAFVFYTAVGIDNLGEHYIGYFYWSAPVVALLVIVLGAVEALSAVRSSWLGVRITPPGLGLAVAVAAAVSVCAAFLAAPLTRTNTEHVDPLNSSMVGEPPGYGIVVDSGLPAAVAGLSKLAGGRPIVLGFAHNAWPVATGLLVQAERTGVAACVADPAWTFMMTSQLTCTPAQLSAGRHFWIYVRGTVPRGMPVLFQLRRGIVTAGTK